MPSDAEARNYIAQKQALEHFTAELSKFNARLDVMHTQITMMSTQFSDFQKQRSAELAARMGHGSTVK